MIARILILWAAYASQVVALKFLATSESAYEGWGYFDVPSPATPIATLVVLGWVGAVLSSRPRSVRTLVTWWLAGVVVVPAWVIHDWLSLFTRETSLRTAVAVTAGFLLMCLLGRALQARAIPTAGLQAKQFRLLVVGLLIGFLGLSVLRLGMPGLGDLGLATIYDRRAEYKLAAAGTFVGYLVIWVNQVLSPLVLILGMHYRKATLVILSAGSSGYVYAVVGSKNSFLLLGLAGVLYWVLSSPRRLVVDWAWPALVLGLSLVPVVLYWLWNADFLLYLVTRRVALVPAVDAVGHALLGDSAASQPVDPVAGFMMAISGQSSDGMEVGSIAVGELLHPGTGNNANSHFLSYSLQWDSLPATLVVAALAAVLLWLFDSLSASREPLIAVPIGSLVCLTLSEFYLHTGLVSGGILLALCLIALLPATVEPPSTIAQPVVESESTGPRGGHREPMGPT